MARRSRRSSYLFKLPVVGFKVGWLHLALAAGAWWLWQKNKTAQPMLPPGA